MCLTCGCGRPNDDHGEKDNITIDDMQAAADVQKISLNEAAQNLVTTLDVDTEDEENTGPLLVRGDEAGHDFHGNQYKEGSGGAQITKPSGREALDAHLYSDHGISNPSQAHSPYAAAQYHDALHTSTPGNPDRSGHTHDYPGNAAARDRATSPDVAAANAAARDRLFSREASISILLRAEPEKRYTLSVAWGLEPDKRKAADGHRVFIKPDVLEATAWNFMRNRKVGLYHQDGTEGHGEVVESYIYRGPDWETVDATGEKQIIRSGYWLVGNVWDQSAWGLIKRGLLNGLSPQGNATFRRVKKK